MNFSMNPIRNHLNLPEIHSPIHFVNKQSFVQALEVVCKHSESFDYYVR